VTPRLPPSAISVTQRRARRADGGQVRRDVPVRYRSRRRSGHHHARCQPGPRTTSAMPLVTRQASSDTATWRSDEGRQAPRPAIGGDLEHTGHGSPARTSPRATPVDGITLSDRQLGETRAVPPLYTRVLVGAAVRLWCAVTIVRRRCRPVTCADGGTLDRHRPGGRAEWRGPGSPGLGVFAPAAVRYVTARRGRGEVPVAGPARRPAPTGLPCGRPGTDAWAAGGRIVSICVSRPGRGGRWRCPAVPSRPVPRWG
jgi:hypothetical protein